MHFEKTWNEPEIEDKDASLKSFCSSFCLKFLKHYAVDKRVSARDSFGQLQLAHVWCTVQRFQQDKINKVAYATSNTFDCASLDRLRASDYYRNCLSVIALLGRWLGFLGRKVFLLASFWLQVPMRFGSLDVALASVYLGLLMTIALLHVAFSFGWLLDSEADSEAACIIWLKFFKHRCGSKTLSGKDSLVNANWNSLVPLVQVDSKLSEL